MLVHDLQAFEQFGDGDRQVVLQAADVEHVGREGLPDVVVKFARDAPALEFQFTDDVSGHATEFLALLHQGLITVQARDGARARAVPGGRPVW